VDVLPLTSVVRIESNVSNAKLTLDGTPITAPFTFTGVEGVIRTLGAVSPQTSGSANYEFASWSDGGAQTHEIATPTADTTFTALFQPTAPTQVFREDFETEHGWTLPSAANTNTATTGRWQRGDPQPTNTQGTNLQLGTCVGGSVNCLITGLNAGSGAGANDVDGGITTIESPPIALPASSTLTLRWRYYVGFLANATNEDFFRVRVVGNNGVIAALFTRRGNATKVPAVWTSQSVNLSAWAGQTVRIRFEAVDAGAISMVEAGVDNVEITRQ
jgi:hypothetical protein